MKNRTTLITVLSLFLLMAAGETVYGSIHQGWSELLGRHVQDGAVDYQGFKKDEAALDRYLVLLAMTNPADLPEKARLALYINLYNASTVKLILDHFKDGKPPASIKKIGGLFSSPWKLSFVRIGGRVLSLDEVEHGIIRRQFREPRIHFAVNCASRSCPPLLPEAYEGERIDGQLEKSTRNFLADQAQNYLDGSTLYLSAIFKWYGADFGNDPASFVRMHSTGTLKEQLAAIGRDVTVKYLDYDWSLNAN